MTFETNEQRSERAYRSVLYYQQGGGGDPEDIEATITDLLTDLLHLASEYGIDPRELQHRTMGHYGAEAE